MTDLGDSDEGFRRRMNAAQDARVVPWPTPVARDAFEQLPLNDQDDAWERVVPHADR